MGVVVEELRTQFRLGFGSLSHHQQSTGVLVYAMYQSHAGVVGIIAGQIAQMPGDGIDQRTMEVPHSRMHHQPGRLVDDHQLVILIDDIKWDILRLDGRIVVRTVQHQCNDITRAHLIVAFHRLVIDEDEACISSLLDTIARGVLHMFRHELVYTHRLLPMVYLHAQVLIQLTVTALVSALLYIVPFI